MAFVSGMESLRNLCKALGIDPDANPVRSVVIDASADSVVTARVERFVKADEMAAIEDAAKGALIEFVPADVLITVTLDDSYFAPSETELAELQARIEAVLDRQCQGRPRPSVLVLPCGMKAEAVRVPQKGAG